jgi:sulfoacetaldehyde dehydrogenase
MSNVSVVLPPPNNAATVGVLIGSARTAQAAFANADQETVDDAVTALAWSLYQPKHARAVAEMAVAETKMGNVADKIVKKQRKTLGTLRDLLRVRSVGIIEDDPARGIVKYAKPVGVVGALTPATNPGATPVNKAMMAIKGRNAIIVAPSPAAWCTTAHVVSLMRAELTRISLPADLVQVLPRPVTKDLTAALMREVDLVVVTGSQANVRQAYASGTPAIGVGAGNVPVIIDETADLDAAAGRIAASKSFDNATSCSSENAVVILDAVYDATLAALQRAGGYLVAATERRYVAERLWHDGRLNRELVASDADYLADRFKLAPAAYAARFFLVEEDGVGPSHPFSGEKLSLVLAVYRATDFAAAIEQARAILDYQGRGHSVGLHTSVPERGRQIAESLDVVRVLVNQAHTFGNGGGFDNGLNFTLSMGCGTWGGNSISENLNWRHFINVTHLVTPIAEDRPTEQALFGAYWARHGTA